MIQIVGTGKCKETAKAIRACRERSIPFQFVDLAKRELSAGEWRAIFSHVLPEDLMDVTGTYYRKQGYTWRQFDPAEELIEHPRLLVTPILRCGAKVAVGCDLDFLDKWGTVR